MTGSERVGSQQAGRALAMYACFMLAAPEETGCTVWHGMAWHGMAWHGMAWHGMAWHGMAWHGIA